MLLLKKVLKNTSIAEKQLAMQDYCMLMHRLDRTHSTHYTLIKGACNNKDECTITEYFASDTGKMWLVGDFVARVQQIIKWFAVQRFAHLCNQQAIKKHVGAMADTAAEYREEHLALVRHAMTRINCYQVRIFGAMLFGMCTISEITGAEKGQRMRDKVLIDEKFEAWAEPFEMMMSYFEADNMLEPVLIKHAWCWPAFLPASAMQFLMDLLQLSANQCAWAQHIKAGLQCAEEAHAEKQSFWRFWKGTERFCPLEQYATLKAAQKASS